MKKSVSFIIAITLLLGSVFITLNVIDIVYDRKVNASYNNSIGELYGYEVKNKGIILQQKLIENKDIQIYGSSELGSRVDKFYPTYFFNKENGFQLDLIGRGNSQSIIHAVNIAALGDELKNRKIVIIISPQWFNKNGISKDGFEMNFSSLQFYKMISSKLDKSVKLKICERLNGLTNQDKNIKLYTSLYSKNNSLSKAALSVFKPYFYIEYKILDIKDKIKSYKLLLDYKDNSENTFESSFNWEENLMEAEKMGKQATNNNEFQIENNYYNKYIRNNLKKLKGSMKNGKYTVSPEFEDLKLLISICKSNNIKPLFISVPVNGKWYDYTGFSKSDRDEYYKKLNNLITSNGFKIADLSNHEYDEYFLKDIMHLGWKGWVYVDKAIYEYLGND